MCNRSNIKKGNRYIMRHMTEESMNNNQSSEIAYKSKKDELKSLLSGKLCYSNSERFEQATNHFVSVVPRQRPSTLRVTTTQVVESSVTINNSPIQDYVHPNLLVFSQPVRTNVEACISL